MPTSVLPAFAGALRARVRGAVRCILDDLQSPGAAAPPCAVHGPPNNFPSPQRVGARRRSLGRLAAVAPALLLAALPAPVAAQTFDRLFTTASERRLLDEARTNFQSPAPVVMTEKGEPEPARPSGPVVPEIAVSGVVIRDRGKSTSWINGSRIRPDEVTPEGIRVRPTGAVNPQVQIQLPDSRRPLALRPGQRIDLTTGSVLDVYEKEPAEEAASVFDALASPAVPAPRDADAAGEAEPDAGGG